MPTIAKALDMAVQHYTAGRLLQAERFCRKVLQAAPRHVGALHLLGLLAHQAGHSDLAIESISRALHLNPNYAEAHNSLGMAQAKQGKLIDAAACYEKALNLKPDLAEAHNNLGNVLRKQWKPAQAVASFQRAVRLKPDYAEAHCNMGVALLDQKKVVEAVASFQKALELRPDYADAHSSLGVALLQQGKVTESVASHHRALHLGPEIAESHSNLGMALFFQGDLAEAETCYKQALKLKPDYVGAYNNLGVLLADQGRLAEALACFQEALRLQLDFAEVHTNLSYSYCLHGDLKSGWSEYEWRWKCRGSMPPSYQPPYWDGSDPQGRRILLFAEQGFGDTIQFIRYAPLVKGYGATVIVECQPPMFRLLKTCAGINWLVPRGGDPPASDSRVPLLSLPRLFGTTLETIPSPGPYLSADPELRARWERELSGVAGFKVGIAWQGNTEHLRDRQRSVPLHSFQPLAEIPGVRLVSLQKGPARAQSPEFAERLNLLDLTDQVEDFADTAALLSHLDLVITVDTAVAHLAGAMGIPVWVAIQFLPEWRWLLEREDSPWYPSMRLFRQTAWGDWAGVFDRLTEALGKHMEAVAGRSATVQARHSKTPVVTGPGHPLSVR